MSLLTEKYASVVAASNQAVAPLTGSTRISGAVYAPVPRYDSATTITVGPSDYYVVATASANAYFDLPSAADNTGRVLVLRSNTNYRIYSNASDINLKCGGVQTLTNVLAYADYQAWVQIQSDGSYWNIIDGLFQANCD